MLGLWKMELVNWCGLLRQVSCHHTDTNLKTRRDLLEQETARCSGAYSRLEGAFKDEAIE